MGEDWNDVVKKKQEIARILDEEDAWVHVVMNYIAHVHSRGYYKYRIDGTPDKRHNVAKIVMKLNHAIDDAMWITKEKPR